VAFSCGFVCAYEEAFGEIVGFVGFFFTDFECAHEFEGAVFDGLVDLILGAGDFEEVEDLCEAFVWALADGFVAELEDGEFCCGGP